MAVRTIFNGDDRAAIRARIARLESGAAPAWGRMDCGQMLTHVSDAIRMAFGELPVARKGPKLLALGPVRYAAIYWAPFPRSAPTAPELLARRAGAHHQERAVLEQLLDRAGANEQGQWADVHPVFGAMTSRDWGALIYKHLDHHLRQFRV